MTVHLRDLHYFVTVAGHLHFTRAAEALFVSQPALSKQIRALENHLRTDLFVRDKRTVELTPAGRALLPHARAMLAQWAEAGDALAATVAAQEVTLVVGFSTAVGRGLLPVVRTRLADHAPAARLRIRQVPWDDPTGGLSAAAAAQRTDAAFLWLPLATPAKYDWLEIATEPLMVAMPAGHRLGERDEVSFADLLDEPFLALPATSGVLRDHWLALEHRGGRPVHIGAEIASAEETVEALTAGLGVCLLAAGNTALVERDGVVVRPVTGLPPSRLVLAWRRGDERPLLSALRAAVAEAVATRKRSHS
ncbi:LysR substrate-binding domain-containing protein [Mycolicibacterium sp. BiH015]|uniref:LysR substrate-binding domain-containing protein n=1 Tax=Mycolicibacterium sp. BiH015 TaxID=3018808 RepID=UPI0022E1AE3E|nr:LysR substrate-binding domain-containing protein [Mycolicibacterium sp. BiH015]MDA2890627.1 LysR substrate-binding domain-containing protein [Mycolicibacterium sp. BiH015]